MTGIGRAPRCPVVAQDIRDLQLGTGHCGGLRRRLVRAASPATCALSHGDNVAVTLGAAGYRVAISCFGTYRP